MRPLPHFRRRYLQHNRRRGGVTKHADFSLVNRVPFDLRHASPRLRRYGKIFIQRSRMLRLVTDCGSSIFSHQSVRSIQQDRSGAFLRTSARVRPEYFKRGGITQWGQRRIRRRPTAPPPADETAVERFVCSGLPAIFNARADRFRHRRELIAPGLP